MIPRKRLAGVFICLGLLFSGSSIASEDAPRPAGQGNPGSKLLKLSEFMPGSIFERMNLVIEIPAQYEHADLPFSSSTASFWMLPEEVKASALTEELPGDTGYFAALLSLTIFYDTSRQTFIGFEDLKNVREHGIEVLDFEQTNVNNYPAAFLSFRMVGKPKTIYFAHIATFIETFVINIQYIPPDGDAKIGAEVWSRFRASLGGSASQ